MKASDYIVEFLIEKEISDVFGYPGGMVTHLMDSLSKYSGKITAHVMGNEQGAAMAACGYAQTSGKVGVAYATSGPGATNMITGICNAYMDSIPSVFITGQVNSFEQKGEYSVRQRGFQETDIVSMVESVTKCAVRVNSADKLKWYLEYAFAMANSGRKGPVLLDIAMDVMRADLDFLKQEGFELPDCNRKCTLEQWESIKNLIIRSKRPVVLLGNGLERNTLHNNLQKINKCKVPIVSSMIAVDVKEGLENYYGFIGAYGDRTANFIIAKSDLVISVGARLDIRQVGAKRANFAPNAQLIRIDIDSNELQYKVHENDISVCADAQTIFGEIVEDLAQVKGHDDEWICTCEHIKTKLTHYDESNANKVVNEISRGIPSGVVITTDVGQNQVWVAQSFDVKKGQRIFFSGGHGAMGYSLPAAIGACMATNKNVYSFNGDGGIQMNVQELQVISREQLPIKVIVLNNNALGMIRHFQEMYFDKNYFQTTSQGGFTSPNFKKLAESYNIEYEILHEGEDIQKIDVILNNDKPALIEVVLCGDTYVYPKLEYGRPNQDQEPLLDRTIYKELMDI